MKSARGMVFDAVGQGRFCDSPSSETESWRSFDVGVAAYPPVRRPGPPGLLEGGSEVLKTRAVPGRLAFEDTEPFRYVVFAIHAASAGFRAW